MKFFTLSIITGLTLWPMIGSAELHKWTDERGNLHITDAPPPELQKQSAPMVKSSPRSVQSMKAPPRPTASKLSRSDARSVPEASATPYLFKETTHPDMVGLHSDQATLTSAWQTFDSGQPVAKAPVQRWKDERGVEHFVDVLPAEKTQRR